MNPWDIFTWIMVVLLAGGAVVIFGLFLKDVGGVLKGQAGRRDGEDEDDEP